MCGLFAFLWPEFAVIQAKMGREGSSGHFFVLIT